MVIHVKSNENFSKCKSANRLPAVYQSYEYAGVVLNAYIDTHQCCFGPAPLSGCPPCPLAECLPWKCPGREYPEGGLNVPHQVCQLPLLLLLPLILFLGMLMNVYEWCQKESNFQLLHAILINLFYYSHKKTTVL